MMKLKKGLDIPISGSPRQVIEDGPAITSVAVLGEEYNGMRPTMKVREGETVLCGQVLFEDKKTEGVKFTSPVCGEVVAINRGAKRVLQSVVINVTGSQSVEFAKYSESQLAQLTRQKVVDNLVESGLWTAFRTRPFSKIPEITAIPAAIFVTAMDTNPLAADPNVVIEDHQSAFKQGLMVLSRLTDKVHVCQEASKPVPTISSPHLEVHDFAGPHPAGLAGTHIHFISPVNDKKTVWSLGYQDVIAFGKLFIEGYLFNQRVISLAGPCVKQPRLLRTILGASTEQLTKDQTTNDEIRVISGSVLSGTTASGVHAYLGRYHHQISVISEGREKELLGWVAPGSNKFSITRSYLGHLSPKKLFNMTTSTNGSDRAMVPIGNYERVMPLDILPTLLLRDLISGDNDGAVSLGCLELDEEDLALCTFVCPGKYVYGPILRERLTTIEREG